MINAIIDAVGSNISAYFENAKIYKEVVKQGFEAPCFCISALNVEDNLFRGERYKYSGSVEVRYYAENSQDSANAVEGLFECLEYIEPDGIGLVRCVDMKSEFCDDYDCLSVKYEFFHFREKETDIMGSVSFDIEL